MNTVIEYDYKLAARRGDLEPYFQPIVDLKSGRLKALEARVRLHVGAETLSAGDVLAHAGSAADRFELDFLILEAALSAFSSVSNNLLDGIQLAINLSPQTLLAANFMARLERTIDDSNLQASRLHLEIPLDTFEFDTAFAHTRVLSLVELGFTVAVDHVGSAHSVETLLNDCPISVFKLDETFVSRLPSDPHACETLSTIVAACNKRNVLVGAEGINRMERLHCLQGVGCDEGQGMLVCRPSRIGDLRKLLERGRCW